MKEEYNLITTFLNTLLDKGFTERGINEAIEFIYEEMKEIKE